MNTALEYENDAQSNITEKYEYIALNKKIRRLKHICERLTHALEQRKNLTTYELHTLSMLEEYKIEDMAEVTRKTC